MKKIRFFCLLLALFLCVQWGFVPVKAQVASVQGCVGLQAQVPMKSGERVAATAKAVFLYELDTETLVYAWEPDLKLDPSGMNKIMTALLAIERGDPDQTVTVTRKALDSVAIGSVSAGLKVGEEISLKDLLYCMMVGSANDAAAVIAEHIGGSQEGFVELMNQRTAELGCVNTHFMNANGLSHEEQYSTARDLAIITCAALENELFQALFCAEKYTVPATELSEERQVVTTNYMISTETVRTQYDERVTGGKTGALSTTDRSLICTAEKDGNRYLSVVMSAKGTVTANGLSVKTFGSFEETAALLDMAFADFTPMELLRQQKALEQFQVSGGENDVVGCPSGNIVAAMPVDAKPEEVTYRCTANALTAPLKKGDVIGTVEIWYQEICVGQCDMIAMFDVDKPGEHSYSLVPTAEEEAKYTWTTVLLVVCIAVLAMLGVGVLVLFLRRRIRIMKVEKRRQMIHGTPKKRRK